MDPIVIVVVIAFLGPILGSFIGVLRRPSFSYVCNMLCFAAGVMLAISFLELIPRSIELASVPASILGLIIGSVVMLGLDRAIPHIHPSLCNQEQGCNVQRSATFLLMGLFLHNFPEGMAIASGTVEDIHASIAIALAIAIHNIPEGICTSASYYHAAGARLRSFVFSSSTSLPIVAGFFTARTLFASMSDVYVGMFIAATAGLMIYIAVDELIPNSCAGRDHRTIFALLSGIVFVMLVGTL